MQAMMIGDNPSKVRTGESSTDPLSLSAANLSSVSDDDFALAPPPLAETRQAFSWLLAADDHT